MVVREIYFLLCSGLESSAASSRFGGSSTRCFRFKYLKSETRFTCIDWKGLEVYDGLAEAVGTLRRRDGIGSFNSDEGGAHVNVTFRPESTPQT